MLFFVISQVMRNFASPLAMKIYGNWFSDILWKIFVFRRSFSFSRKLPQRFVLKRCTNEQIGYATGFFFVPLFEKLPCHERQKINLVKRVIMIFLHKLLQPNFCRKNFWRCKVFTF